MNRFIVLSLLAGCIVGVGHAGELDLMSRAQLRFDRLSQSVQTSDSPSMKRLRAIKQKLGVGENESMGMIKLAEGQTAESLEQEGVKVIRVRGDFAFVSVPSSDVERVAALPAVERFQLARTMRPMLDKARAASGVDAIHSGAADLPHPYTGKGVITGIVDGGVDPNHINFRDDDGNTRVGFLSHVRLNSAGTDVLETKYGKLQDLPVSRFTTDDNTQFHGTHTLGIMAGGYKGMARVAEANMETGVADITEKPNPYYGVATESEIAVSCGDLMDMLIAMGMDNICNFAYEEQENKRVVINLSLGSNVGPHDGTDVMHQYINQLVAQDNAIICVSAGNEGDLPIALHGTFDDTRSELKTFIRPFVYSDMRYGKIALYSQDTTVFKTEVVVFNRQRNRIAFRAPVVSSTDGDMIYYVSSSDYAQSDNDHLSIALGHGFDGYIGVGSQYDQYSGRYYALVDYYCINSDNNADDNYLLGLVVTPKEGEEGKRVDIYSDGTYCAFDDYDIEGWDEGMYDGTISDMACGDNILVVGSYNTRDTWGSLDGNIYGYNGMFPAGEITNFSSYGRLPDGTELPHVCAPGAAIISSTNSYYVENAENGINNAYLHAEAKADGRTYNWQQTTGTSMSTPFVAGAIATWLEANPELTINDVKEIVALTSTRDEQVEATGTPLQWGAGKFNALEGLKEAMRRSAGINETGAPDTRLVVSTEGEVYTFFLGGACNMNLELFDISGKKVASRTAAADQVSVNTEGLPAGIYVARVNGSHTSKIMVK